MNAYEQGIAPKPLKYYTQSYEQEEQEEQEDQEEDISYCLDMEVIEGKNLKQVIDESVDAQVNTDARMNILKYHLNNGLADVFKIFSFKTDVQGWDDGHKNIMLANNGKYYIIDFGQTFLEDRDIDERFYEYITHIGMYFFEIVGINKVTCKFLDEYIKEDINSGFFDGMKLNMEYSRYSGCKRFN